MKTLLLIYFLAAAPKPYIPPPFSCNQTCVTRLFNYHKEPAGFGPFKWGTPAEKLPKTALPAGTINNCTIYKWRPKKTIFSVKPQHVAFALSSNKLIAVSIELTTSNDVYTVYTNLYERYGQLIATIENADHETTSQVYVWKGDVTTISLWIANTDFTDRYAIEPYTLLFQSTQDIQP